MIELRNLAVGYRERRVLENAELSFLPGEVTALIGPNGSGKSTLIRTVLGLLPKLEGEILLDGKPVDSLLPRERAQQMAYLAQFRAVPNITVKRMVLHGRFPYLGYPRRYRPEDYEIVEEAMRRAGVEGLAQRSLSELSGGQRQRAYLAMALAQDTPCIFFDEPTTYLDVGRQLEVMRTARELAGEGKIVVLALHDLPLALRGADRIVVLDEGQVRFSGTPEQLYQSGVIPGVFGVKVCRVETESGCRYYYE